MTIPVRTTLSTKDRLLETAQRLMLAKGFTATSVEEICTASKLTKGSFLHYFDSKETLGKELLARFCQSMAERMGQAVSPKVTDPLARVYAYVDFAITMSKECRDSSACLLGTFAQELSDTNPAMRSQCATAFERWGDALKRDLDAAKAKYAPRRAMDTASLANLFISVLEGAKILAKTRQNARIEEQSLRHFKQYLKSLFET